MSVSDSSWESILELAEKFYDRNLKLYYTTDHLDVILKILTYISNVKDVMYVFTRVTLIEPLMTYDNLLYISIPLVAELINLPVNLPQARIKFIKNVNIFESLFKKDVQNHEDCSTVATPSTYYNRQFTDCVKTKFSNDDLVRITHLIRLILMCRHYLVHIDYGINFQSHKDFPKIECAARKPHPSNNKVMARKRKHS